MNDLLTIFKEVYVFIDDMTDFITFLAEGFSTVPTVFIILFSLTLVFAIAFGFFHLIVTIVTH